MRNDNVTVGIGQAKTVTFDLRQESKQPISLANLFELVADDLQTLNDNLLSVSFFFFFTLWHCLLISIV